MTINPSPFPGAANERQNLVPRDIKKARLQDPAAYLEPGGLGTFQFGVGLLLRTWPVQMLPCTNKAR